MIMAKSIDLVSAVRRNKNTPIAHSQAASFRGVVPFTGGVVLRGDGH